ncbi:hypothetical protein [Bradyrhizobium prioriisuperbiae]|uniref:hypothetical protein n=1 Tax=Bradyrhizobium prioriisuperbiae TaxID=2854389 RepID=UPI0028E850D3|nr:hypothetical protein [Bradyrhizobium prioritasuperba]
MSKSSLTRSLRVAACVLGIGLCLATGAARAGDDDEDDTPLEDRIMKNIMSGLGGTNMDNKGIDYRERSPLVVPRSTDLPPPEAGKAEATTPANWPKDPTVAQRKASAEAAKQAKPDMFEMNRTLTPSELAPKRSKSARSTTVQQPGSTPDAYGGTGSGPMLNPNQLGFSSSMIPSLFKGNSTETGSFKGEPTRDNLTQPPVGYQTPSPNYAYGSGPMKPLDQQTPNPLDPNSGVKRN